MSSSAEIIALLRRLGVHVRVRHLRWTYNNFTGKWALKAKYERDGWDLTIDPHGGETHVALTWHGDLYVGSAVCSKSDTFNRRFGLRLALMRAIAQLPVPPTAKKGTTRHVVEDGHPASFNGGASSSHDGLVEDGLTVPV